MISYPDVLAAATVQGKTLRAAGNEMRGWQLGQNHRAAAGLPIPGFLSFPIGRTPPGSNPGVSHTRPTAQLPNCPTAQLPNCPTAQLPTAQLPYCPTAPLPHCPTALLPHCPTALLPYCPTALLPYCPYCPTYGNPMIRPDATKLSMIRARRSYGGRCISAGVHDPDR